VKTRVRNKVTVGPQQRVGIIIACAVGLVVVLSLLGAYVGSAYAAADRAAAALARKELPQSLDDTERASIAANLHATLDQIIPAAAERQESLSGFVIGTIVDEVRGQLLAELATLLTSSGGLEFALYGWQTLGERAVTFEKEYLEFPNFFSVMMQDSSDGTPLAELILGRSAMFEWKIVAVRAPWLRSQRGAVIRQLITQLRDNVATPNAGR